MKNLKEIEERKKEIIEKYGLFMEKQDNLAPIAARIFTTLLLDKKNGITFDNLVTFLEASKSTISTNLKILENLGIIEYYTKPGDRKKYFQLSKIGFLKRIEDSLNMYETELELLVELMDFKKDANKIITAPEEKYPVYEKTPYLDYLSSTIKLINQLRKDIKAKCHINSSN